MLKIPAECDRDTSLAKFTAISLKCSPCFATRCLLDLPESSGGWIRNDKNTHRKFETMWEEAAVAGTIPTFTWFNWGKSRTNFKQYIRFFFEIVTWPQCRHEITRPAPVNNLRSFITKYTEKSFSLETDSPLSQEIHCILWKQVILPCSQDAATGPSPEPDESSPQPPTLFPWCPF
jgi:hypothetical protein